MKTPYLFQLRRARQHSGSALIICLSMVVIMTILLVGYVTTARLERGNASVHVAGQKAQIFSEMAVNHARATVLAAFDNSAPPGGNTVTPFATGPGRVVRLPETAGEEPITFDLTSGTDGSTTSILDITTPLNGPGLISTRGALLPNSSNAFPVRWIYIRRDGSLESGAQVPTYNSDNPLIGRYAFYTDDESAHVNLNTAWTRDASNSNNAAHPSKIDLRGLGATPEEALALNAEALALNTHRQNSLLASPLGALGVDDTATLKAIITDNASSFTHFNHSPATNVFGKQRRVLTTKAALANGAPYFDILAAGKEGSDPGDLANLNTARVAAIVNEIYNDLKRTDWPMLPGKSFVEKYGPFATAQIVLDIVEYVRSCESSRAIVEPIRGAFDVATGTFSYNNGSSAVNSLIGNSRRLLITEVAVEFPKDPVTVPKGEGEDPAQEFHIKYWVELHYPALHLNLGGSAPPAVNLTTTKLFIHRMFPAVGSALEQQITAADLRAMGSATTSVLMNPGDYRVVTKTFVVPAAPFAANGMPSEAGIRLAISRQAAPDVRYNVVPLDTGNLIPYPVQPGKTIGEIQSLSVDDPRVNNTAADWKLGAPSFGAASSHTTLGGAPSASPEQDTQGGVITAISMGYPRAQTPITSPGQLGLVHTGVSGATPGAAGTPWRSIRLQPKNDSSKAMLPDWALLELFAASTSNPTPATQPRPDTIGGLVNINTALYPFTGDNNTPAERPLPLKALLTNATATKNTTNETIISETKATTLATNIAQKKLATQGVDYSGVATSQNTPFYAWPGELLEVEGTADGGEESEAFAREVLPLVTTRSNVFRVHAVGQSIRQGASNNISVLAEQKTMSLLELDGGKVKVIYEQDWGL